MKRGVMKKNLVVLGLLGICTGSVWAAVTFLTPAAGSRWDLTTTQVISWQSTVPLGDGCLELYKGGSRIGRLNATVPLGAGEQSTSWVVGEMTPVMYVLAGTGYTIRLNRYENGPLIGESASFEIIVTATFATPASGAVWAVGTNQNVSWSLSGVVSDAYLVLYRAGAFVSTLKVTTIPPAPGNYSKTWTVGDLVPPVILVSGSGYTIRLDRHPGSDMIGESAVFSISGGVELPLPPILKVRMRLPIPPDCPCCGFIELKELQMSLEKLSELAEVSLFFRGKPVSLLGRSGKGSRLPSEVRVAFPPEAFSALGKGQVAFELRLVDLQGKVIQSREILLSLVK